MFQDCNTINAFTYSYVPALSTDVSNNPKAIGRDVSIILLLKLIFFLLFVFVFYFREFLLHTVELYLTEFLFPPILIQQTHKYLPERVAPHPELVQEA